jgi:putative addiction module killer protein
LFRYQRENGREPFTEFLSNLRDKVASARIRVRLRQPEAGNFGDCEPVGSGVIELRVHVGAGYRVIAAATATPSLSCCAPGRRKLS